MNFFRSANALIGRRALLAVMALCVLAMSVPRSTNAYVLLGRKWPAGDIVMYLQLGSVGGSANIDGTTSWDAVASGALASWNQYLGNVKFKVATTTISNSPGDSKNSVFFSNTVFGEAFGSDVLALTVPRVATGTTTTTESDVVLNTAYPWNSYRGDLRPATSSQYLIDARRVLLHEFGHVLGLAHVPQSTQAIMVPSNSNIDSIQQDDINGVVAMYGTGTGGGNPTGSAPVITSGLTSGARVGMEWDYRITATNSPTVFGQTNCPPGVSFNAETGVFLGTPTQAGDYRITISATNAAGTGSATLVLNVYPPEPVVTSATSKNATVGVPFSYQITANIPTTAYNATNLPPGLMIYYASGSITGTPTAPGTYDVPITASNTGGSGHATLRINVSPAIPVINSGLAANVTVGQPFTYTVTGYNSPTSFAATGLPAGLSIAPTTGIISGTPTTAGTYGVNLTATNSVGPATATLVLTVTPVPVATGLPVFTGPDHCDVCAGQPYYYQLTATNNPTFSIAYLPAGASVSSTGLIGGQAIGGPTYTINVVARNSFGEARRAITLNYIYNVSASNFPRAETGTTVNATVGTPFSYPVGATAAAGLPEGLTLSSGQIVGAPTTAGVYNVSLSTVSGGYTACGYMKIIVGGTPPPPAHAVFFTGEMPLSNGVYYLTFPNNNNLFGYYAYLTDPHYIYHFDMGYEYWFDAADGKNGAYLYDFKSGSFFYTSPTFAFPYLYDFSLNTVLYYYPDPNNPGRYNTDGVRYFYNYATGKIITK